MSKILLIGEKENQEFTSFEEMFQAVSEKGIVITAVEDGVLKTKDKKELSFAVVETAGTKDKMVKEVSTYRDGLRQSIVPLMKQGIVTKEQAAKLKEQFDFLDKVEAKK